MKILKLLKCFLSLTLIFALMLPLLACGGNASGKDPKKDDPTPGGTDPVPPEDPGKSGKTDDPAGDEEGGDMKDPQTSYAAPLLFNRQVRLSGDRWMPFEQTETWIYDETQFINDTDVFRQDLARTALLLNLDLFGASFREGETAFDLYDAMALSDVQYVTMTHEDYDTDKNDLANVKFAAKLFQTEDGKLYQLITVAIDPYVPMDNTGWTSNFDVGADTDDYLYLNGPSSDWTNKKEHKGFSVTAERLFRKTLAYLNDIQCTDATPVFFVTGQSRGAALANLLGKRLLDKNLSALVYGFNTPETTTENDGAVLASYSTVFNVINGDDIVSKVPLTAWGFARYGQDKIYTVSESPEAWNAYFGSTYVFPDPALVDALSQLLLGAASTRDALYAYDTDPEGLEERKLIFPTEADRDASIAAMFYSFPEGSPERKYVELILTEDENGFAYTYQIRPALLTFPLEKVINAASSSGIDTTALLLTVLPYLSLMPQYLNALLGLLPTVTADADLINRILYSHVVYADFVGITLIP